MRLFLRSVSFLGKGLIVCAITFAGTSVLQALFPTSSVGNSSIASASAGSVEVWWPKEGAEMFGVQPMKAMLQNKALSEYQMFWQVDGGNLVSMHDSQTDYPHKEADIDFSGWNWNQSGEYKISFIAQNSSGQELARTAVTIKHGGSSSTSVTSAASATSIAPTTNTSQTSVSTSESNTLPPAPFVSSDTRAISDPTISIWWPKDGASLSGLQPIKAAIDNASLTAYKMYWSVEGGSQVEMLDSLIDSPHKENVIDFSSWMWKGAGPYTITVTAKDLSGNVINQKSIKVTNSDMTVLTTATATQSPKRSQKTVEASQTTTQSTTQTTAASATSNSTLSGSFYVDPNNPALAQADAWKNVRPSDSAIMLKVGSQSTAIWLGGWNGDVQADVANTISKAGNQNAIATFIAYNIPNRDCGQYSAGGLNNKEAYLSWIQKISNGLGNGKAILVLEPDALSLTDCLTQAGKDERYSMISSALDILKANANTKVYIDAGHGGWINTDEMASRLKSAGISKAAGFALNVSNFVTTSDNIAYGEKISQAAGGAHFIIDTSRNGSGPNGEWCNPSGRSLGSAATLNTGNSLVDALLWLKRPGESDGNCNGGPSAGTWWPEYALDLAVRAGY